MGEYSVHTLSDEEDSFGCVIGNASISESEYILNLRRHLSEYPAIELLDGESLDLLFDRHNIYKRIIFLNCALRYVSGCWYGSRASLLYGAISHPFDI